MNNIPTFEEATNLVGLSEPDYDTNKPEEAGSTASDFLRDSVDPEVEDMEIQHNRWLEMDKSHKCPKCGYKHLETWEVGTTTPDDFDITGVRAKCVKCGFHFEFDW